MSNDTNREYYRQRAFEERLRAEATGDCSARRVHEQLAERYSALAGQQPVAA